MIQPHFVKDFTVFAKEQSYIRKNFGKFAAFGWKRKEKRKEVRVVG
jgi:hypothetical protein